MHITRIARSAACRSTATRVTIAGKCGSLRLQRQEHFTMRFNGLITISLAIVSLAVFGPAQARPPLYIVQAHTASEDRQVATRGLLGNLTNSLTKTTSSVVNTVNSTLATNPLVTTVTSVATPVLSTVETNPLVSTVTTPVVSTLSSVAPTQDGMGVLGLTLTYETNYPMEVGADTLQ